MKKISENKNNIALCKNYHIAIVIANYYEQITEGLKFGALAVLKKYPNITTSQYQVKGSFELPIMCQKLFTHPDKNIDAIITLGAIIKGETAHFDFICQQTTAGIMQVMLEAQKVIALGILTVNDSNQAKQRSAKSGQNFKFNRGSEAAIAILSTLQTLEKI